MYTARYLVTNTSEVPAGSFTEKLQIRQVDVTDITVRKNLSNVLSCGCP